MVASKAWRMADSEPGSSTLRIWPDHETHGQWHLGRMPCRGTPLVLYVH